MSWDCFGGKAWAGYRWYVTLLQKSHYRERYKQHGRALNARQNSMFYVKLIFYNTILGLREEHDPLNVEVKCCSASDISNVYDDCENYKDSTIKQNAGILRQLPSQVIESFNDTVNSEHRPIFVKNYLEVETELLSESKVMSIQDCRAFRNFFNVSLQNSATIFTGETGEIEI